MTIFGLESVNRSDPVYKACLTVSTAGGAIVGGATGSVLGPIGSAGGYLGGGAWGFSLGYLACPYLAPAIKRKFELGQVLTVTEVSSAADAMSKYAKVSSAPGVLKLVAIARANAIRRGSAPVCADPVGTAKTVLRA